MATCSAWLRQLGVVKGQRGLLTEQVRKV